MKAKKGLERILADVTKTTFVVVCKLCGKQHRVDSKDFVILYGDVRVGLDDDGALIIGNIDSNGKIIGSTILCKEHDFVQKFIDAVSSNHDEEIVNGGKDGKI
jgi:hypothetical protein